MQDAEARAAISEKEAGIEMTGSCDGRKNVASEKVDVI